MLTALLVSALLHLGLVLLSWLGPSHQSVEKTSAQAPAPLHVRLLPAAPHQTPPAPAPGPAAKRRAPPAPSSTPHADPPRQLSRPARPLDPINLDIPEARLPTVHGTLILKLWINEKGQVVAYEPEPTDLPAEYVTAVGDTLTEVRFAPALVQGRPAPSIFRLEIDTEPVGAPHGPAAPTGRSVPGAPAQ